ncbi:DNA cytosine methyltransferase [Corynebacterium mastitidis]
MEFFAGIGLARAGMEQAGITTVWANDYDPRKQKMYEGQWGRSEYVLENVHALHGADLPTADVAWSSSPCTDLSLAGKRVGLRGGRESSAFFGFTRTIREMGDRSPEVLVLENVVGLASSHGGEDLIAAAQEFNNLGYDVDVVTLDARRFVPQSRPRLFMVGAKNPVSGGREDTCLRPDWLAWLHALPEIRSFHMDLPEVPDLLTSGLTELLEPMDELDPRWWERVERFVDSTSAVQHARLVDFMKGDTLLGRTAYRRTRDGAPVWEMRAQDISGCLRTARGGSSKQAVAVMGRGELKVRWMTGLEYAQLMGAGDYQLTDLRDSQIYYGFGDAVAVPAVAWVAEHMIIPNLANIAVGQAGAERTHG